VSFAEYSKNVGRKGSEVKTPEKKIILNLHKENKSYADISAIVKRPRSTIQSIIQKFKKTGSLRNSPRCGRPRKLSARDERKILQIIKAKPSTSASSIAIELRNYHNKVVHAKTVSRCLRRAGFYNRMARRKPFISKVNQKKRLDFAQEYVNADLGFWNKVIFSDESKFTLFKSGHWTKVWR
jgi:transposase